MANISSVKPGEKTFPIIHPKTGEKLGINVTIMSMDDERYLRAKRSVQDAVLKKEQSGRPYKSDELESQKDFVVFSSMVGWEWGKDENGEQAVFGENNDVPEFNRKNVLEVFKQLPWFRRQVDDELGDTVSFY